MATLVIQDLWNLATSAWNLTGTLLWAVSQGGKSQVDTVSQDPNEEERRRRRLRENRSLLTVKVHNKFLTEQQVAFFKKGDVYSAYKKNLSTKAPFNLVISEIEFTKKNKSLIISNRRFNTSANVKN